MGNLHLVTGYSGAPHITAEDHGALNYRVFGSTNFVFSGGAEFEALTISNNCVRICDGDLMLQGRHVRLAPGAYVDLTIENGTSGYVRFDLIVARYTKDAETGEEECNLVVLKGTPSTSQGSASYPAYNSTGDVVSGAATIYDFPLYCVVLAGLNIDTVERWFNTQPDLFTDMAARNNGLYTAIKNEALLKTGGTMTGNIDLGLHKITSLPLPANYYDAANKGYVDNSLQASNNKITTLSQRFESLKETVSAIPKIQYGKATLKFYTTKASSVEVTFDTSFSSAPVVMVSQVFNTNTIVVFNAEVSKTGFTAHIDAVGTDGSRDFSWVAIGS